MSKLGKQPIPLPKGVEVKVEGGIIHVKGPKGAAQYPLASGLSLKCDDGFVLIEKTDPAALAKTYGLCRALVNNMVVGVSKGFEKKLSMVGVGYRAALQGHSLDLQVGNSHPTRVPIPKTVQVAVDKSVSITITGIDKHAVGQFAATVRAVKPPEPYKGKGIRYEDEYVRKKAGKAAKAKTAAG
jgi:large subunit ribosomal protein L6